MKTKLLLLLLFFTGLINAQIINIPDGNFKYKLLFKGGPGYFWVAQDKDNQDIYIDSNGNGEIEVEEAQRVAKLYLYNSGISSLEGIQYFTNLTNLDCSYNSISQLNVTALTKLSSLNCLGNKLTTLDVSTLVNLTSLTCYYNQILSLDVSMLPLLTSLYCNLNKLTSLDVSNSKKLQNLDCGDNLLTSVNISGLLNLTDIGCKNNKLTKLDVTPYRKLERIDCSNNAIEELNFEGMAELQYMYASKNPLKILKTRGLTAVKEFFISNTFLTELNLSDSKPLEYFGVYNNALLTSINIKNGGNIVAPGESFIDNNPLLKSICVDEGEQSLVLECFEAHQSASVPMTTDCGVFPTDYYNTIKGTVSYDVDNKGCNSTSPLAIYTKVKLSDGITSRTQYVSSEGKYLFYVPAGNFKVTPEITNSAFTVNPTEVVVGFTDMNNIEKNQDFCINATNVHANVAVSLEPMVNARPGFDASYKIILINKGTNMASGVLTFNFDGDALSFVSALPAESSKAKGVLTFNFSGLMPFEYRGINVVLHVNGANETPAVNVGDILKFTATAVVIGTDINPEDNTIEVKQKVVSSLDPNNIICAQGEEQPVTAIGDYLHYVINFENIGTAAAEFVVVTQDINPADFDIESLELLNTSHNVTANVKGTAVEFRFDGINLAAKATGNIVYKIKSLKTLKVGDSVMNKASIVFDFNEAIATNEAVTTFTTTLGADDFTVDKSVKIYPNPAKDVVRVETNNTIKNIQLYDVQGRVLQTVTPNQNVATIDVSAKAAGIYFLKVTTAKGTKTEKLIKQ